MMVLSVSIPLYSVVFIMTFVLHKIDSRVAVNCEPSHYSDSRRSESRHDHFDVLSHVFA